MTCFFVVVNIVVVLDDDGVVYNVVSDCFFLINDYAFVNVVFRADYAIVVVVHDNIVSNSIIVLNEVVLNDVVFVI